MKENVIQHLLDENKRLNEKIKNVEIDNKILSEKVLEVEKSIAKTDQYDRRNNVEFHGIPNDIDDVNLEEKVIDICKAIGVKINSTKIEACHRFGRGDPKKVIARFVNRKDCDEIRSNKKNLKKVDMSKIGLGNETKIYNQDNLSPYFSELAWKCRKLKKVKKINDWWYRNEMIFMKRTENENAKKICHNHDIEYLYPGFNYSG